MTEEQHQSSSSLDSSGAFDAGAAQDFAGEAREHVVVPGDTLAGLCLKYAVSARALRTLNKLDGDNVQGVAVLAIPPSPAGRPAPVQAQTRDVVARRLRAATRLPLEDCVARLEAVDWDFGACVAAHEAENDPFSPAAFRPPAAAARGALAAGRRAVARRPRGAQGRRAPRPGPGPLRHRRPRVHGRHVAASSLAPRQRRRRRRRPALRGDVGPGAPERRRQPELALVARGARVDARARDPAAALRGAGAPDLRVQFELFAPNELLPDSPLGETQPLPLSRFADGALHTVMIEPRGDLTLSLTAPDHVPRDVVRAVAVGAGHDAPGAPGLATIPLVEARAVNVAGERVPGPPPRYEATACCLATPLR
ncbi:hypothetical protein JL722_3141 [Aureococcus anophagefferens]|nr:hypothetical protein JL722_3141 [Aureococcus anophagefferens]